MIGTMSNTLILAYVGGSLGLVMVIYAYSYQMHQILNMYSMAIEIMRGISGTMGIILTVPITSLIMSFLLTRKTRSEQLKMLNNHKPITTRYITPSTQLENMPYSITGPAILNI